MAHKSESRQLILISVDFVALFLCAFAIYIITKNCYCFNLFFQGCVSVRLKFAINLFLSVVAIYFFPLFCCNFDLQYSTFLYKPT